MQLLPIIQTLSNYNTVKFRWDIIAGITLAMFVLPESMAYANLAGLPGEYGIYCCLIGGLFFALFTSTQQVAVGPTSAISLMVGTGISSLSKGDLSVHIAIASLTAMVVFAFFIGAYLLRLYSLSNFVGDNILVGFKTGAAISIASTQIPIMLGLQVEGGNFLERVEKIGMHMDQTNFYVLGFSIVALSILYLLNKRFPGKPNSILLVIAVLLLVYLFPQGFESFSMVGAIPKKLPDFIFPALKFEYLDGIVGLAFGCFLMAFIETSSVARSMAETPGSEPQIKQEMLSLGAANLGVSLAGAFPVSGGLSQSQVNAQAGAKTSLALIFCSGFLAFFLLYMSAPLAHLPQVLLAVLVVFAVSHLVKFGELKKIRKLSKAEFRIAIISIIAVLIFGILKGVVFSSILSLAYVITLSSNPRVSVLGRIPESSMYSDVEFHPDNILSNGILILRVESSLLYFNQQNVYEKIVAQLENRPGTKALILDFSATPFMDTMGAQMINKLNAYLANRNIKFKIVEALVDIRELLRKYQLEQSIGKISRRVSLNEAVQAFQVEQP